MIPFPHSPAEIVGGVFAFVVRQLVLTRPESIPEQTFPTVQGENSRCGEEETGFIM
jgi:hypothetical protein